MADFAPLTCVGCGTTQFDPDEGAERRPDAVMSRGRFWVMGRTEGAGPAYAVCNRCLDQHIGFLWNADGTLSRTWFGNDS